MAGINLNEVQIKNSAIAPYGQILAYRPHKHTNLSPKAAALNIAGSAFDTYPAYKLPHKKTVDEILNQVARMNELKKGKSFKGYCGLYVAFQLKALGIFTDAASFLGNGNKWYHGVGGQQVSRKYALKKYPGPNCLEDIARANGNAAYNIVVCFSKGRYGHVLFIHAIINGRIFFTDSFKFNNIDERKLHILTIQDFKRRYLNKGHRFMGALHFCRLNPM